MKKHILLALILAAGWSVYPQATRTERRSVNEKGNTKKEAVRSSTRQTEGVSQQKSNKVSTEERSGNEVRSRSQSETQSRTQGGVKTTQDNRSGNAQRNARTSNRIINPTKNQAEGNRVERPTDPAEVRVTNSGSTRVYREAKGSLTRDDGTVYRHQNEQVFTRNRFNVDYSDYSSLRRSDDFRREYDDYYTWYDYRVVRNITVNSRYRPVSAEVRRERYPYRQPMHYDLIWTPHLFNRFMYYYPYQTYWEVEYGREIETISSYDAGNYVGTVRRVYGRVEEVYYSRQDNNYLLYMGARFPYHDLSVIIPRSVALRISGNPDWYFENEFVWLVGLIDLWDDRPEIVVRDEEQIRRY